MTPLINRTLITPRLFREGARRQLARKYNRLTVKVGLVLLLVLALLGLLTWKLCGTMAPMGMEVLLFALVLGWIRFSLPRSEWKRAYRAMVQRSGGGTPCRELRFEEDRLLIQPEPGEALCIPYAQITDIRQTRHALVLTCADGTGVLVDKAGFTAGDAQQALELLRSAKKQ